MRKRLIQVCGYAALTIVFLIFVCVYHTGIHNSDTIEASYFVAQRWLFLSGAALLSVGILIRKQLKADAWFLSVLGASVVVAFIVLFLQYGGISAPFDAVGYTAANAQLVILDGVAIACFVRCAVLCGGMRDASAAQKWMSRLLCIGLAVTMLCLIITERGVRFAQYEDPALEDAYSEQ